MGAGWGRSQPEALRRRLDFTGYFFWGENQGPGREGALTSWAFSMRSQPYLAVLYYRMASYNVEWRLARAHPAASQPQRPGGACRG